MSGPSAGPLPSRPAIPAGDRATYPSPEGQPSSPFVDIRNLTVTFTGGRKPVKAVGGVDLQVRRGEVVALIGESGSGKSVTLRSLLRLHPPHRTQMGGQLMVGGTDVLKLSPSALADYRGKVASMIFQEPLLALDPVYTVGAQIAESIRRHEPVSAADARQRALQLFERVRIPSPERRLDAYPHEMSGGMRQRAMIALALACRPQLLLADEPTTALDATVQIQILLLLRELQREMGLAVIFVTHDIGRRPHRRDVRRPHRRGRPGAHAHPRAAPPLHDGAAAEPRPRGAGQGRTAGNHRRRAARPVGAAARLRVRRALQAGVGRLPPDPA